MSPLYAATRRPVKSNVTQVVAGVVAKAGVDTIGLLGRLLRELDAALLQLVQQGPVEPGDPYDAKNDCELGQAPCRQVLGEAARRLGHQDDDDEIVEKLQRPDGAVTDDVPVRTRRLPQICS